jgi:hypothetical protein
MQGNLNAVQQTQTQLLDAGTNAAWDAAKADATRASEDFDEQGLQDALARMDALRTSPVPQQLTQPAAPAHWAGEEQAMLSATRAELVSTGKHTDPVWMKQATDLAANLQPRDFDTPAAYIKAISDGVDQLNGTAPAAVPPPPAVTPAGPTPTDVSTAATPDTGPVGYTEIKSFAQLPAAERTAAEAMWIASPQSDRAAFEKQHLASVNHVNRIKAEEKNRDK